MRVDPANWSPVFWQTALSQVESASPIRNVGAGTLVQEASFALRGTNGPAQPGFTVNSRLGIPLAKFAVAPLVPSYGVSKVATSTVASLNSTVTVPPM